MNERIRELAEQAGIDFFNSIDPEFSGREYCEAWTEQQQKFAELIIQECVSTLNDMHLWQSVNNQNYPNAWHDAVDQGIDAIKSHFGVE